MTDVQSDAKAVFFAALDCRSPAELAAHLNQACAGDAALRNRVEHLLRAHRDAGNFLDRPALRPPATLDRPLAEHPGSVIGPYKLLEQIGEGGFGVVFMAEQQQPIQRKVALKVIKPGTETNQVIARFEAERQAVALMDHPNIAKLHDAGTTESGRPYFVMELVHGVPVTDYCDRHRLSVRERLELFVTICQAVQHAHQKGIIHRDLKPTNVLVTQHDGRPLVKVIDFGVAKATGQKLTDKTLFTGVAQLIGTPLYMSPEQAELNSPDVDTRSDIYSLGVLLYELLTGSTPFESQRLKEAAFDELRRIIREEEPPRPSTRISTLAQQAISTVSEKRSSDPRQLSRLFQGELDWIAMKSLDKDRNRRYETASALADDIECYLHDEPVQACPPSKIYRLRKFVRRNRNGTTLVAILVVALMFLLGGAIWTLHDRAIRQESFVKSSRGQILIGTGQLDEAETLLREALRLDPNNFSAHNALGRMLCDSGQFTEAFEHFHEAIRLKPDASEGHRNIAFALVNCAKAEGTVPPWDEVAGEFVRAIDASRDTYHGLVLLCQQCAIWDEVYERVATLRPGMPALWIGRARNDALRMHWTEAAANYAKIIFERPIGFDETTDYAFLLLLLNDQTGYQEFCRGLLDRHGGPRNRLEAYQLARAFAAGPATLVVSAQVVRWAAESAEGSRSAWFPHVLGLAQYRAGDYDEAIKNLRKSNSLPWCESAKAQNWFVLAMAYHRLGDSETALNCRDTGLELMHLAILPSGDAPDRDEEIDASDFIPMQVLSREAEAVLKTPASKPKASANDD